MHGRASHRIASTSPASRISTRAKEGICPGAGGVEQQTRERWSTTMPKPPYKPEHEQRKGGVPPADAEIRANVLPLQLQTGICIGGNIGSQAVSIRSPSNTCTAGRACHTAGVGRHSASKHVRNGSDLYSPSTILSTPPKGKKKTMSKLAYSRRNMEAGKDGRLMSRRGQWALV